MPRKHDKIVVSKGDKKNKPAPVSGAAGITLADLPPFLRLGGKPKAGAPTAAELLSVGRTTVWRMIRDGKLRATRLSQTRTLVESASVIEYLERCRVGGSKTTEA
jgi:excisionase family DNA binding protein